MQPGDKIGFASADLLYSESLTESTKSTNKANVCTCQADILCDGQSMACAVMARELFHNTLPVAHDSPKVRIFRGFWCDVSCPKKSAAPRSWSSSYLKQFRGVAGGRKTCCSFDLASVRVVVYFVVVAVLSKCEELHCMDFPG
jgi:hypothetical protein